MANSGFINNTKIKSVILPSSITSLGQQAFYGCTSLIEVSLELSSMMTIISTKSFAECTALTSVKLPDAITTIATQAFYKCSQLENISIPQTVSSIGAQAFKLCSKLTSVKFETTSDWVCGTSTITAEMLSVPETAAEKLRTVCNEAWEKQ